MSLTVRHATASGRLDEMWKFDPTTRRLAILVRIAEVTLPLDVLVCSHRKPDLGAHPIVRISSESWRILPERVVRVWPHRIESLAAIACPIGDALSPGQHLILSNTPPSVNAELEAL